VRAGAVRAGAVRAGAVRAGAVRAGAVRAGAVLVPWRALPGETCAHPRKGADGASKGAGLSLWPLFAR
jgi:hypothetical protein